MPKSQLRYNRTIAWQGPCSDTDRLKSQNHGRLVLSTPRRKVSFEQGRNDSKSSICSDDTVLTKNSKGKKIAEEKDSEQKKSPFVQRKRSLLARPITSLSLVDLARSVVEDESSSMTSGQDDGDFIGERKSKRIRSLSLSPRSIMSKSHLSTAHQHLWSQGTSIIEESRSVRTSPWGHFIDMVPDEDDNFRRAEYPNFDAIFQSYRRKPHHALQSRLRRRPSPYGEYESFRTREAQPAALNFVHFDTDSNVVHGKPKSRHCLRLPPKNQSGNDKLATDRLIGVFSELQLRQEERKTSGL
eukprot:jgi/Psemu1/308897/fgenesh1_kg.454_\